MQEINHKWYYVQNVFGRNLYIKYPTHNLWPLVCYKTLIIWVCAIQLPTEVEWQNLPPGVQVLTLHLKSTGQPHTTLHSPGREKTSPTQMAFPVLILRALLAVSRLKNEQKYTS